LLRSRPKLPFSRRVSKRPIPFPSLLLCLPFLLLALFRTPELTLRFQLPVTALSAPLRDFPTPPTTSFPPGELPARSMTCFPCFTPVQQHFYVPCLTLDNAPRRTRRAPPLFKHPDNALDDFNASNLYHHGFTAFLFLTFYLPLPRVSSHASS